ncbi:MAG: SusC/RagA family TonB-linked outer membrane protein [Bacteroides sp.]|nr:SusC/RagA family TonB-linked outer membrane protein [Bacteroides sp.]
MKIFLVMQFVLVLSLTAANTYSQNIVLEQKDATLGEVINTLKQQSDYTFWYKSEDLDLNRRVSIEVGNQPVDKILHQLFDGQGLSYKIEGNYIMIYKDQSVAQQPKERTIKGVVKDATGEPIIGANVTVEGTTRGCITDLNGAFTLSVPVGSSVVISYIGYTAQTIQITASTGNLNIELKEDSKLLNEVVVTALGVKRETKALGYAVAEVKGDALNAARPINAMGALSGKVAGVDISSTTAGPSGSTRVVIRGNSELSGNNQPLYVIDGVPMDNSQLGEAGKWGGYDMGDGISSINPDDIESLSVLKGASAAALYGSRATHGVVLITTKSAKRQGFGVEYSTSVDFVNQLSKFDDYQRIYGSGRNGELPTTFEVGSGVSQTAWGAKLDPTLNTIIFNGKTKPYGNVDNNISSFFRTGTTFTNALSMTAASEKANVRFSISDMRNNDIVPESDMNRTSFMVKAEAKLSKRFRVESRINYVIENVHNRPALSDSPNNIGLSLIGLAPNIDQAWLSDGYVDEYGNYVDWNGGNIYRINPYWSLNKMSNESSKHRVMGYLQANYEIIDGLNLQLRGGTDFYKFRMTEFSGVDTPTALQGSMSESSVDVQETNLEAMLRYSRKFGEWFDVSAFVGGNLMFFKQEAFTNSASNQVIPGLESITNYVDQSLVYSVPEKQVRSLYGAVNLGFKNTYYLDFTLRNDWSSTLAKGNNSYMYPSVSGSFVFSNLLKSNNILSFGKVRASWAEVGGDTSPYKLNLNYGVLSYTFNSKPLGDILSTSIPNRELKPTRTYSYEFGTDLRFLNNRIGLDFTYYSQRTKNQIVELPISNTTGFENATVNCGEISNKGIEVSLNGVLIETKDWSWDVTLNYARNKNKVESLHPELKEYTLSEARWAGALIQAVEGESYGVIVGKRLKRTANGEVIYGNNGLPEVGDELEVLGNGVYDWTGGLATTLSWKGLTLNALFDIKWGADVYSMSSMMAHTNGTATATLEGRREWYESEELRKQANISIVDWVPTGGFVGNGVVNVGTADNPVYEKNTTPVDPQDYWTFLQNANTPEPFIYDASFIKLREVTLSYTLDKKWLKRTPFTGVGISVYGRNLWTIHSSVPNIDPESSYNNGNGQGFEYGSLPSRRSFGFSLKVSL